MGFLFPQVLGAEGTLVYVPEQAAAELGLVWVDRDGREEALSIEPSSFWTPRLSPDGKRLAIAVPRSGTLALALIDLDRATRESFERHEPSRSGAPL